MFRILKGFRVWQIVRLVFYWFLHRKLVQAATRVSNRTFQYLCEKLGPLLRKLLRNPILMEDRIAVSLI